MEMIFLFDFFSSFDTNLLIDILKIRLIVCHYYNHYHNFFIALARLFTTMMMMSKGAFIAIIVFNVQNRSPSHRVVKHKHTYKQSYDKGNRVCCHIRCYMKHLILIVSSNAMQYKMKSFRFISKNSN